jgi:hypothetical protein
MDFDEIAARRKPRETTTWVVLDHDLVVRHEQVERDLRLARLTDERENRIPQAPKLQAELDELEQDIHEAAVPFRFRAMPRKAYRELIEAHPDPAGEKRWNDETFPPALIAACAVDPEMTLEQATTVYEKWDENQASTLFATAYIVNEGETKVPLAATSPGAPADSLEVPDAG